MTTTNCFLMRVYGDVEPIIVEGPFEPNKTEEVVIKHFKRQPYSDNDGLFILYIKNNTPEVEAFSASFITDCVDKAESIK